MGFLAWIILGGIAGWIGSILMNTDESQGVFLNVIVGIVGAFVGGLLFNFFGSAGVTGFNLYSLIVATIGAIAFLWVMKMARAAYRRNAL